MSSAVFPRPESEPLLVLCIMSVASLEFIQNGMLNFAASPVMGGIGAAPEEFSYAAMAYAIMAVLALFNHRWLAQRLGARTFVQLSLALFAAGAICCAQAETPLAFILGRAMQGAGGATFFTAARVQVNTIEGKKRLFALLFFGYSLMFGSALGPLLGSWLLTHANWRWIFWGMLPWIAVAAWAAAGLREVTDAWDARAAHYQPRALLWLVAAVFCLQFLIQQTPYDFFGRPRVLLGILALVLIAGLAFMLHQHPRGGEPGIWLQLAQRRFLFGLVFYFVCYCLIAANNYIMPMLVQQAIGFDVPTTGVLLSVSFLAGILFASVYAHLLLSPRKPGLQVAMVAGAIMLVAYGYLMSGLNAGASFARIVGILLLNGGFLSVFIAAVAQGTFQQVEPAAFSHAYQTKNIVRQVAISSAVALSTVFLQARNALHYQRLGERFSWNDPWFVDALASTRQALPQLDPSAAIAIWGNELVRQSMLLSCLDFFRLEAWVGLALAIWIARQKTFR